jgi:preprotein translocase YajC subunit
MTHLSTLVFLLASTTAKKSNPLLTLLPLVLIVVAGYFFFIKPQQRKAAAARANAAAPYEVGDEVQTIGGVVGTILEIHGDRYTLLTGHTEADGNLDGPQPTRIVFIRQAIARKVDPIVDVAVDDDADRHTSGRAPESFDIEKHGDEEEEAEEA